MPKLLANKRLLLTRYWTPHGSEKTDSAPKQPYLIDGILPNPDDFGWAANSGLQTLATIEDKRCFALLGQPGLGKSIVIEQWVESRRQRAASNDVVLLLRGRELASADEIWRVTVDAPAWKQTRKYGGEVTLVIDGLDEALQRLPVIVHTLCNCLENEPPERTRVVLVSRVADWRESRSEKLFGRWSEADRGGAYELCPLTWNDVQLAAKESGVHAERFVLAVHRRRVAWMAGRPKLLLMLLEEFRQHRRLPNSRHELFRRAAERMCAEHDPERHEVLERSDRSVVSAKCVYRIVARIAATLLLCGKSHVILSDAVASTEASLPFEDLIGGVESLPETTFEVDKEQVSAALDSAHFIASGPNRLRFDHQSMAEFMAAEYLHHCTLAQLRSLLVQRIDGIDHLLPQFREVSAWLAVQHREFGAYILHREPRFLLEADAVELDENMRRNAVSKLLEQMDREEASDSLTDESFLQTIRHPRLTQQLRPYIVDGSRNVVVRRTAIRFAGVARCKALKSELWQVLSQPQQISVRRATIHALGEMAGPEDKLKFLQVLRGAFGMDDEDELRGEALKFLVPRYLPVRSVLKHIVPYNDRFYGSYWHVVEHHLPENVRSSDVLPILRSCLKQVKVDGHLGSLQKVAAAAIRLAFQSLDDATIYRVCINFLAAWTDRYGWQDAWEKFKPNDLAAQVEVKLRRIITEGFVTLASRQALKFWRFHLRPTSNDMGWLLEKLRTVRDAKQREVWADYVSGLTFQTFPKRFKKDLQSTYAQIMILRSKLPKLGKYDLLQTLERRVRAVERRNELLERRRARREKQRTKNQLTVAKVLDYLREGNLNAWPYFIDELRRQAAEQPSREGENTTRSANIAVWPGWSKLSIPDQRMVKQMAITFLQKASVPQRKFGKLFWYDGAAVYAIVLSREVIAADAALQAIIRKKWVLAILHGLFNDEVDLVTATSFAYKLDRQSCLAWARKELVHQDTKNSGYISLRRFKHCWDDALTKVVTSYVPKAKQQCTIVQLFVLLNELDKKRAKEFWRKVSSELIGKSPTKRGRIIAFLGLVAFPQDGWIRTMKSLKRSNRSTQIKFFTEQIGLVRYEFRDWTTTLDDQQLADLYLLLIDLFPPHSLQEYSHNGIVTTDSHIADWQKACMGTLIQRGTASSCAEINRIAETVPPEDRIWIRFRQREAVDQRLRTEWVRDQPSVKTILRLAHTATARWVRDAGELQEAVLASLDRLQAAMHVGLYPEVPQFWREPGKKPVEEVEVSRLVAKWIEHDLRDSGIVTDREPQIGHTGRADLKIEIPASRSARRPRLVNIIEVKLCSHRSVETACLTQLATGYLQRKGLTHGIYLVAWFGLPGSRVKWITREDAQNDCAEWARKASIPPQEVRGFALDCRWKNMESPSVLAR